MIKAVAFDFDGTLVDSNPVKRDTFFAVLGHLADAATIAAVLDEDPLRDRWAIVAAVLARVGADPGLRDELVAAYAAGVHDGVVAAALMPGAETVIERLHPSFPAYVVSATPEEPLLASIRERGLDGRFKGVYGKPTLKPILLQRIAEAEAIATAELLMVGDQPMDRTAAREAGCPFLATGELAAKEGIADDLAALVDDLLAGRSSAAIEFEEAAR